MALEQSARVRVRRAWAGASQRTTAGPVEMAGCAGGVMGLPDPTLAKNARVGQPRGVVMKEGWASSLLFALDPVRILPIGPC